MLKRQLGFTLIEMLVVAAIVGITLAIALPSFKNAINNNAIVIGANELISTLILARNEAAKRGSRVALCRSANPSAAAPTCGGTANTWTTGWLVYAVNNNRNIPLYDTSQGDVLLATGQPTSTNIIIKTSGAADKNFEYNPDGSSNEGGSTAYFAFCDNRGYAHGRLITILPVGRPKVGQTTSCTPS